MKVAMFGGAFDPIHKAHIKLAEKFSELLSLDKVIFMPTFISPHKDNSSVPFEHRYNMCKLACAGHSNFEVSDLEFTRQGKSYSYKTLEILQKTYGNELYMIVGADMYLTMDTWKFPERIFEKATVLACPRDEQNYKDLVNKSEELLELNCNSILLKEPIYSLSSSEVREKIYNKSDVSSLLDRKVLEYIHNNKLYGCD